MATSVAGLWAAGDCVQTHHAILKQPGYLPLGTTAHKQGRIAGENALGGRRRFEGSLGTQIVKVFDVTPRSCKAPYQATIGHRNDLTLQVRSTESPTADGPLRQLSPSFR